MVTDAANSIHVHTVVCLVIFCSNQHCHFPVDSADIQKQHNLGNLVAGAGRGASKECNHSIYEHASEVQSKMIFMGHQISSCHVPVVRLIFIL
jgi:hypothetical protein